MNEVSAFGVTLQKPPTWEDRTQMVVVSDTGADFRANVVVVREERRGRSIDELLADHFSTLDSTFDSWLIAADRHQVYGRNSGHLIDYTFRAGGIEYRQLQFFVTTTELFVTFTYSNTAARFDTDLDQVLGIFGTAQVAETADDQPAG
jgi:hypothetical protein